MVAEEAGMKIQVIKLAGGILAPSADMDAEALSKLQTNGQYEISVKRTRNPKFHKKVFSFFNFAFHYWACQREFMDEAGQFDTFRKQLTILAGYYDEYVGINGDVRIEAKSLAYGSMTQQEFESCYHALIGAAMKYIFTGCGQEVEDRLMRFF